MDMVTVLLSWGVISGHVLGAWSTQTDAEHTAFWLTTAFVGGHFLLHAWFISGWNGSCQATQDHPSPSPPSPPSPPPPSPSSVSSLSFPSSRNRKNPQATASVVIPPIDYAPGSDRVHEVLIWSGA